MEYGTAKDNIVRRMYDIIHAMDATTSPARRPGRLRKRHHPLTREAVAAAQRARLLDGMARAVSTKGYAATTVADVVAFARVSRSTFYQQFRDTEECFLATFDDGVEFLLGRIGEAVDGLRERDWRSRARVSLEAYLTALAARPDAAWAFTIEALGAGPHARERRAAIMAHWAGEWRALQRLARRDDPAIPETTDDQLLALVGGIEELVRECLRAHGAQDLPKLADAVTDIAVSTLAA